MIVLGMGAPRQEALARRLREVAPAPVGIVCGGAILDFLAGRVARAPRWMRARNSPRRSPPGYSKPGAPCCHCS